MLVCFHSSDKQKNVSFKNLNHNDRDQDDIKLLSR